MAKNQPHPNDPARQQALARPAEPPITPLAPSSGVRREHGLASLNTLRTALRHSAQRRTDEATVARQAAHEAAADATLFRAEIGAVTPLNAPARANVSHPPPPAMPRQACQAVVIAPPDSLSDAFDPALRLDDEQALYYHSPNVSREVVRKLRSGAWNVQAQLDLHGMRSDEARSTLVSFLHASHQQGLRCLRIIHGKGLSSTGKQPVLKNKVRAWLTQKEEVIAYCEAPAHSGGAGAVLVLLQPTPQSILEKEPGALS